MYGNGKNVTYCDSFGVEHIPKETKKFVGNKNITINIYRIQVYDSIMCRHFCIGFIVAINILYQFVFSQAIRKGC